MLRGVKIIEWGEVFTAPFCGKLLADLGADVVKVEALPGGDPGRALPPFAGGEPARGQSLLFAHLNARKRGVALDIASPSGRELFEALLDEADALIEDRPLAEKEASHLTYDDLHRRHPHLVVTSLSTFGQTGPYRYRSGYPSVAFHMSGAGSRTPPSVDSLDQPPLSLPGRPAAMTGGLCGAGATVMALLSRRFDGQGRHVDIAETETVTTVMASVLNQYAFEGTVTPRDEPSHGIAPFDFYEVEDGYASVFLVQEAHWTRLVELMGDPDWADVPMFADRRTRAQYNEDLDALLEPWMSRQRGEELYLQAQAKDIPIGPVRTMDQVFEDRQLAHRQAFQRGRDPALGEMLHLLPPYRSPDLPWHPPPPAPGLGQHTYDVLAGWLGLSPGEVTALAAAGVV